MIIKEIVTLILYFLLISLETFIRDNKKFERFQEQQKTKMEGGWERKDEKWVEREEERYFFGSCVGKSQRKKGRKEEGGRRDMVVWCQQISKKIYVLKMAIKKQKKGCEEPYSLKFPTLKFLIFILYLYYKIATVAHKP